MNDQQGDIALHIFVYGRVQGVGFRSWAASRAKRLGITGWVRNCPDGTVELVAEGKKNVIETYIDILQEGNGWSSTEFISADPVSCRGYCGFDIE
jgi:acylphosphatase